MKRPTHGGIYPSDSLMCLILVLITMCINVGGVEKIYFKESKNIKYHKKCMHFKSYHYSAALCIYVIVSPSNLTQMDECRNI
jgi:hypothetical protein